jgi:predicted CXXCH cytochrome family protein
MSFAASLTLRRMAPLAVLVGIATSCTDESIVFRDRILFEDPPDGAGAFLGYTDEADQLTVCGNCHVGQQAEWELTGHAEAWATLQASDHAQAFCENCHSTNQLGNTEEQQLGYAAVQDSRYHDVQCESCHGPGLEHVTNPDATQPLAPLDVGVDLTFGCGECHSGSHHPFVDEWTQSAHGERGTSMQTREECVSCHEGRAALEVFGVDAEYIEKDQSQPLPIVCGVCHDPHDATNGGQLRFSVSAANIDKNLCMRCHQKRAVPELERAGSGPHSPQGPLLLGQEVGWIPPNFQHDETRIVSTHGTERNPNLCATCHVRDLQFTDDDGVTVNTAGHLFKAIPCLENGLPSTSESCALTERSFASCTDAGCHGNQDAARSAYISATEEIADLVLDLEALLAQVPQSEFNSADTIFTTAEGARFNSRLGAITSSAVHNPFLTEALLRASIRQVEDDYGVAIVVGAKGAGR